MAKKSIFRYNQDEVAKQLMEIQNNCEQQMAEAFREFHTRKAIASYQAGYHQALHDYGIPHDEPDAKDLG